MCMFREVTDDDKVIVNQVRRCLYWISTNIADTSVCDVAADNFFAISNAMSIPSFSTRFARHSF